MSFLCPRLPLDESGSLSVCVARRLDGHVSFRNITPQRLRITRMRVAITAAARALDQEAIARLHVVAAGLLRLIFIVGADADDEAAAAAVASAPTMRSEEHTS